MDPHWQTTYTAAHSKLPVSVLSNWSLFSDMVLSISLDIMIAMYHLIQSHHKDNIMFSSSPLASIRKAKACSRTELFQKETLNLLKTHTHARNPHARMVSWWLTRWWLSHGYAGDCTWLEWSSPLFWKSWRNMHIEFMWRRGGGVANAIPKPKKGAHCADQWDVAL